MIRTSKHNISNITNKNKINLLDSMFADYKHDLLIYIGYIIDGVLPLKNKMSSKLLPTESIKHSKYKRDIYIKASEIIRSQIDKAKKKRLNRYRQIYAYFKTNNRQTLFTNKRFSELSLNNIMQSKYFTTPVIKNLSINLTGEFFDTQIGNHFDNFISIKLPYFNKRGTRALKINIPIKNHKHSNSLKQSGFALRNNIQIKKVNGLYFVCLVCEKPSPTHQEKKVNRKTLGIDIGVNKLLVTSDGQFIGTNLVDLYSKFKTKKRGSKNYKSLMSQRDNLTNQHINSLDLSGVDKIVIEDLCNLKRETNMGRGENERQSHWVYREVIKKIERTCEANGILLVKVSPAYTSQACSGCGAVHRNNRKGEKFKCIDCGMEMDADLNASINIRNKGVTVPLT